MSGCFGNSKEDRAMANELNRYLKQEEESEMRAQRIDAMADDIYKAKLAALPLTREVKMFTFTNIGDALSELDRNENLKNMIILGGSIRDGAEIDAGRMIIKLVTNQLRKEAQDEAENECA